MNDMTLTLRYAGVACAAARTRSRSQRGIGNVAGMEPKRDRVAVAGGAH